MPRTPLLLLLIPFLTLGCYDLQLSENPSATLVVRTNTWTGEICVWDVQITAPPDASVEHPSPEEEERMSAEAKRRYPDDPHGQNIHQEISRRRWEHLQSTGQRELTLHPRGCTD